MTNIQDLARRPDEIESAWKSRIAAEVWDEIPQMSAQKRATAPLAPPARATPAPTRNSPPRPPETAPKGERRYTLKSTDDMSAMIPARFRVKNILMRDGLAAIFGPFSSGKSFAALDLAFAMSDGLAWFGRRVEPCDVLYIVLEGEAGLAQRVKAYRKRHGATAGKRLRFITAPFSLLFADDVDALVASVIAAGIRDGVIIIDTLNAATPGIEENGSADMGLVIAAVKRIREACGGLVILVHHAGKDATKGLRGHSSLGAALDTIIEITRDGDRRFWKLAKSKDGTDGEEYPFRLEVVEVGTDEDGDSITSCVVVPEDNACDTVRRVKVPRGGNQRVVYDVAGELLREGRNMGQGGAPATRPCIRLADLITACRGRLAVENDRVPERVRLAVTGLVNSGCIILRDDWIWLP